MRFRFVKKLFLIALGLHLALHCASSSTDQASRRRIWRVSRPVTIDQFLKFTGISVHNLTTKSCFKDSTIDPETRDLLYNHRMINIQGTYPVIHKQTFIGIKKMLDKLSDHHPNFSELARELIRVSVLNHIIICGHTYKVHRGVHFEPGFETFRHQPIYQEANYLINAGAYTHIKLSESVLQGWLSDFKNKCMERSDAVKKIEERHLLIFNEAIDRLKKERGFRDVTVDFSDRNRCPCSCEIL